MHTDTPTIYRLTPSSPGNQPVKEPVFMRLIWVFGPSSWYQIYYLGDGSTFQYWTDSPTMPTEPPETLPGEQRVRSLTSREDGPAEGNGADAVPSALIFSHATPAAQKEPK